MSDQVTRAGPIGVNIFPQTQTIVRDKLINLILFSYLFSISILFLCQVIYVIQADPKGWIPKWAVNMFAWQQALNVARIRKIIEVHSTELNLLPLLFSFTLICYSQVKDRDCAWD